MALLRMDHVGVVVDDLPAAVAFFEELGLEPEGKALVEGGWVDRIVALDGVRADIVMLCYLRGPAGIIELAQKLG
jgi:catechol 2,3-dioxygenase-like lactoylglutathione lyase family enzyme